MPSDALDLTLYPWAFWLAVITLLGLTVEAANHIRRVWAIPALLIYVTIGAWYVGDIIQTGPGEFLSTFSASLTNVAFLQVTLFLVAYRVFVHRLLPRRDDPKALVSVADKLSPVVMAQLLRIALFAWMALFFIGLSQAQWNIAGVIWPPSNPGEKVGMFSRHGIGVGADFLLATGGYIYVLICALFGMIFVLARGPTRWFSFGLMLVSWPYYLFDRTRSAMLALLLPPIFCYLISTWGKWWRKIGVTSVAFTLIYLWFGQVMHYRDADSGAYQMSAMLEFSHDKTEQLGLDMLKELCYMDHFVEVGDYKPNWGALYMAEVVSIVPRTFWPGKPLIGYDYAYARGFRDDTTNGEAVYATISTGMIGQGIANFGRFFGVLSSALLMALWTRILAKLWYRRFELPRFLLFLVGCGLTFNLGRDITLLILWPFVFGYVFVVALEWLQPSIAMVWRSPRPSAARALRRPIVLPQKQH